MNIYIFHIYIFIPKGGYGGGEEERLANNMLWLPFYYIYNKRVFISKINKSQKN